MKVNWFVAPDDLIRFEPHHVAYARFGNNWYNVTAMNGVGMVLKAEQPCDIDKERSFYLANGAKEEFGVRGMWYPGSL